MSSRSSPAPLFVRESGPVESPAALLLHGQVLDGEVWAEVAGPLAHTRRVLVPDLPGYGRSPAIAPFSLEAVAAAVEASMEARGIRDLDVIGFSLGTYHALALALGGRLRVRRLYLLGPFAGGDVTVRERFAGFAAMVRAGAVDPAEAFVAMSLGAEWAAVHPQTTARVLARARTAPRATIVAELEAAASCTDLRPSLAHVRAPTLVRVGTADVHTPPAWAEEIAAAIPGARLERADGVGHLYAVQEPAALVASVTAFVA
ncbi:MAG TPA: alpha/beta fold hydrolase [Anaeromyxobacter sp.]|nr:alpha/beta fold hydrolase [Anaeromyxobacter sp.]